METITYKNSVGDAMLGLITDLQINNKINGFRTSFRIYNMSEGIGGFETTVIVKNVSIDFLKYL